jgi:hypothetical protein
MVNNFRNRIRQPIEKLMHSIRRLLELQPEGEQKQLVESLREGALLLQTSARDSGSSHAAPAADRGENQLRSDDPRQLGLLFTETSGKLQP